jgi:Rrf2 family transcriptional regulator, nitric oxide-sensitive transcriptional repressor
MQLTSFTDYSLRVLVYLSLEPDRIISTAEIGTAYGISHHQLGKVVRRLGQAGWIEARRGRGGGLRLAHPAEEIVIGQVVRQLESRFELVECFNCEDNSCPITPVCGLSAPLRLALESFHRTLDGFTLADIGAASGNQLRSLLGERSSAQTPSEGCTEDRAVRTSASL